MINQNDIKYRGLKGVIDTAFEEGKLEGILKGEMRRNLQIAKALKLSGISNRIFSQTTGLTKEQVENLN